MFRPAGSGQEIRAMDRRRFIPGSESLEQRAVLSSNGYNTLFGFQLYSQLNLPITYEQKTLRIERLPFYIEQIRPGRYVPKPEMKQIQASLTELMDTISKPPTSALNNYNYQLRKVVTQQSLSASNVHRLNYSFTAVMNATKAPPSSVQGLSSALYQLVSQVDTASPQPAFLGSNDYSLVLQTALAVGRPMPPPTLPHIARNQGVQANVTHIKTPLKHPSLVGSYHFHTTIQIVSPSGVVFGAAKVNRNDNYRVRFEAPLPVGVYSFQLRAIDTVGHVSRISHPFFIKVVPRKHH